LELEGNGFSPGSDLVLWIVRFTRPHLLLLLLA
jgi:hypothetical protein